MPSLLGTSGPSDGFQITGTMVRVMMFQSLLTEIGITGWMLRMFWVPFSGPKLRLVLFWNGKLIKLPTGFCASFANSSSLNSARACVAASAARRKTAVEVFIESASMGPRGPDLRRTHGLRHAIEHGESVPAALRRPRFVEAGVPARIRRFPVVGDPYVARGIDADIGEIRHAAADVTAGGRDRI